MYSYPMLIDVFCLPLKFLAGFINPDVIKHDLILYMLHKRFILIIYLKCSEILSFNNFLHEDPHYCSRFFILTSFWRS